MPGTSIRTICFVTGTRAEFGLMERTLRAIDQHPSLNLKIVATGMHLDRTRGYSLSAIRDAGFRVAATVPWPASKSTNGTASSTGQAMAALAACYKRLKIDIVLVVGDRVEAFAAAAAAHISGLCVAHVHGGDRAPGVIDDSLRHAITKLAHVHFPATQTSADRIARLGEDPWRIHRVGSPGLDGIHRDAARSADIAKLIPKLKTRHFALVILHPSGGDDRTEHRRATQLLAAVRQVFERAVVVYPNNDPGAAGIVAAWDAINNRTDSAGITRCRNLPRSVYLGLLRDAAVLVGNSSSGIIEAASFGTPVVDVGTRQHGREHGDNVVHTGHSTTHICQAIARFWRDGVAKRCTSGNPYGEGKAAVKIARVLAKVRLDDHLLRKLIAY